MTKNLKTILAVVAIAAITSFFLIFSGQMNKDNEVSVGKENSTDNSNSVTVEMKNLFSEYIIKEYPDWNIEDVAYDPMCDGSEAYDVSIKNNQEESKSIILKKDGTFVQVEEDALVENMPVEIIKTLNESFAEFSYGDTFEVLYMANGETHYLVDISDDSGRTSSELVLSANGSVLCQN